MSSTEEKVLVPEVLWAQRSSETDPERNYLLLTIGITDCTDPKVTIEPTFFELTASSQAHVGDAQPHNYKLHIDFYKDIVPEKTLHKVANGRHFFLKVFKKDLGIEYWPRLTKEKIKYGYIKTDFNKWVDEDEQDGDSSNDASDMDFSKLMGGAGAGANGDLSGLLNNPEFQGLLNKDSKVSARELDDDEIDEEDSEDLEEAKRELAEEEDKEKKSE